MAMLPGRARLSGFIEPCLPGSAEKLPARGLQVAAREVAQDVCATPEFWRQAHPEL
jgi:hypothetical protein